MGDAKLRKLNEFERDSTHLYTNWVSRELRKAWEANAALLVACEALLDAPMMTDATYDRVQAIRAQARMAIVAARRD